MHSINRRNFLKRSAAAAVLGTLPLTGQSQTTPASSRINLGFIGVGMMGRGHLGRFLGYDDVQLTAICELEPTRRKDAVNRVEKAYAKHSKSGNFKGCAEYVDFRKLLARTDIDAVVIAIPDHMHTIVSLEAARAKKDIYCEKPLTHSIHEGRMIVDAVQQHGVVFQTGSQQRSEFGGRFRKAVELIWAGRIGRLKTIRVGVGAPSVACDLPSEERPKDLNWEMWLGPAGWRGYNEILCPKGNHRHFPAFRKYWEFAGGSLADIGAHHFDIAQWAMEMDHGGPTQIDPPKDGSNTGLRFRYGNGVEMFHGGKSGITFEGTDGTIYVNRPVLEASDNDIIEEPLSDHDRRVYPSSDHRRNWVECIQNRTETICPPEIGHRTATVCHLANLAYRLKRNLTWSPRFERFQGDAEANRFLLHEPRAPWSYEA